MIHTSTHMISTRAGGTEAGWRELVHVAVAGEPGLPVVAQARTAIERAVVEVERTGVLRGYIVRSRLWARDAAARQAASGVRLEVLTGALRAASSSFIDPERLPAGCDMMIELYALAASSDSEIKLVREYDPPIAPPQFVVLDGLLVLSGDTDRSSGLEQQMASIRRKIDVSLAAGGGSWARVVSMSVFLARRLPTGVGRAALASHFPATDGALVFTPVEGYSNPEKLVEIEVTADLG